MSRTYRKTSYANANARRMKFRGNLVASIDWVEQLEEEGYGEFVTSRDRRHADTEYITNYNDVTCSGSTEMAWVWDMVRDAVNITGCYEDMDDLYSAIVKSLPDPEVSTEDVVEVYLSQFQLV